MPAVRRQLQPLPGQFPDPYPLQEKRGFVLDGPRLLPPALKLSQSFVAHGEISVKAPRQFGAKRWGARSIGQEAFNSLVTTLLE